MKARYAVQLQCATPGKWFTRWETDSFGEASSWASGFPTHIDTRVVDQYRGKIIKTYSDGKLTSFEGKPLT